MSMIKELLLEWSRLLALPKPKILPSRLLQSSHYEKKGRSHQIHVRMSLSAAPLAFHELGHFFLEVYYGDIVSARKFTSLFGDRYEDYDSPLLNMPGARLLPAKHYGFASLYAEAHPEEDWAECFSLVMMCINDDEDLPDTDDEELDEKLIFVKRVIEKAMKKSAA